MAAIYSHIDEDIYIELESMNRFGMFRLTTAPTNGYFRTTLHDTIDGATMTIARLLKDHGMSINAIGEEMETIIYEFMGSNLEVWYDEDEEIAYVMNLEDVDEE